MREAVANGRRVAPARAMIARIQGADSAGRCAGRGRAARRAGPAAPPPPRQEAAAPVARAPLSSPRYPRPLRREFTSWRSRIRRSARRAGRRRPAVRAGGRGRLRRAPCCWPPPRRSRKGWSQPYGRRSCLRHRRLPRRSPSYPRRCSAAGNACAGSPGRGGARCAAARTAGPGAGRAGRAAGDGARRCGPARQAAQHLRRGEHLALAPRAAARLDRFQPR